MDGKIVALLFLDIVTVGENIKRIIWVREVLAVLVLWVAFSWLHSLHSCNGGEVWCRMA